MSQHVFLMILSKTLQHSKEKPVFGVRGYLGNRWLGTFCRTHDSMAIDAGIHQNTVPGITADLVDWAFHSAERSV